MYGTPPDNGGRRQPIPNVADAAPELDCLRDYYAPDLLRAAAERGRLIGIGADRVLIQWGVLDEASYLSHLAAHTGVSIDTPADTFRSDIPLPSEHLPHVVQHGLLPLRRDGEYLLGIAPRILTARWLSRFAFTSPDVIKRLRLLPTAQLNQALIARAHASLAYAASEGLNRRFPGSTAAPSASRHRPPWRFRLRHACVVAVLTGLLMLSRLTIFHIVSSVLAIWFLAFSVTRIAGALIPQPRVGASSPPRDEELPVYTIIAALYDEAASIGQLLQAIVALDYPKEKLDVILVVEPDDHDTRAAIARWGPPSTFQVLVAPATLPRTKPKALNWALPFARGSFVTVYDAEDIPEPNQLRAALEAFRAHGARTVCVQASLCINNPADSWLSCMFAAEYAGQFDVFLPGLAMLGLPLPLGGSSNHFRTATLREIGGWDAYNVTEDADLGFRLARAGYRAMTFASTTFEEAPAQFGGWLRQRSRWMKGWMQTWAVHMRAPHRLWRETGIKGLLSLNLLIGGNVLTALAAPILLLELAIYLSLRTATDQPVPLFTGPLMELHALAIVAGYASTVVVGLMGLARRGQLCRSWVLLLTPIYWALLSVAAWRALHQLFKEPYRWEKTEHGLAAQRQAAMARWESLHLAHAWVRATANPRRDDRFKDSV
ncbi:MAG: glycosyltransferase [Xanthobacteraceae bacterium]